MVWFVIDYCSRFTVIISHDIPLPLHPLRHLAQAALSRVDSEVYEAAITKQWKPGESCSHNIQEILNCIIRLNLLFPTCQVRVVRFYLSCLLLLLLLSSSPPPLVVLLLSLSSSSRCPPRLVVLLVLLLNCDSRSTVFAAGPQPRSSTPSVPCRTSTTTIHAQCSLPDLNHGHLRPVVPAGPQPRPSTPSVPCRTSTASIHAKCSLPDLM